MLNINKNSPVVDFAFIGAGPASLAAAMILARETCATIAILDAGGSFSNRGCPGIIDASCSSCSGIGCRVTEGVGGSSAGFGNKLCMLPASSGCVDLVAPALRNGVSEHVAAIIGRPVSSILTSDLYDPIERDVSVKHYQTDVLFRRDYRALLMRMIDSLHGRADIRSHSRVSQVLRLASGGFALMLDTGQTVHCKNLVVGSGRASAMSLPDLLEPVGLSFGDLYPDVGLRVELETRLLSPEFIYQNDPKFKIMHRNGATSRTFCTCRDGNIVPVKFGDTYFADGSFLNKRSGKTNVALMVRAGRSLDRRGLVKWCSDVNATSTGSLMLASLPISTGCDLDALRSEIFASIPTWPTEDHSNAMSELLAAVISEGPMSIGCWSADIGQSQINVYGPSVDAYWSKPEIDVGFTTNVPGLSVIGDAAGYSRGVVQAIYSGVGWAMHQFHMGTLRALETPPNYKPETVLMS